MLMGRFGSHEKTGTWRWGNRRRVLWRVPKSGKEGKAKDYCGTERGCRQFLFCEEWKEMRESRDFVIFHRHSKPRNRNPEDRDD